MALSRSNKPTQARSVHLAARNVVKLLAAFMLTAAIMGMAVAMWSAVKSDATGAEAPATKGQVVVEAGAQPSTEELAAAEYLAGQGRRVRLLPRDPNSADPQPDAQLDDDDFPTEIKTVGNITSDDVTGRLAGRIREALGQAPSVVIDARKQLGLTKEDVESAMKRAFGMARKDNKPIKRIHVIGPNGVDVNWDYTKS